MDIPGYTLLLQDFCQFCPDFEAEVESVDSTALADEAPRTTHNIRCKNRKRCARIAANISRQVMMDGKDK